MTPEDRQEATDLQAELLAQADEYVADPQKGFDAGYSPNRTKIVSREINSPEPVRYVITRADWLRAIAARDVGPEWEWKVRDALGGGTIDIQRP